MSNVRLEGDVQDLCDEAENAETDRPLGLIAQFRQLVILFGAEVYFLHGVDAQEVISQRLSDLLPGKHGAAALRRGDEQCHEVLIVVGGPVHEIVDILLGLVFSFIVPPHLGARINRDAWGADHAASLACRRKIPESGAPHQVGLHLLVVFPEADLKVDVVPLPPEGDDLFNPVSLLVREFEAELLGFPGYEL